MAGAASSQPLTGRRWWTYDVFLSFRGADTRSNFTDHLYYALTDAGISAYRDDIDLPKGAEIASQLLRAIHESRICLVVFSENYADSRWCLEELSEIVACRKTLHQLLLPVFYDVDPLDVRNQTNSFAKAFSKHEVRFSSDLDRVAKWRAALTEAGDSSGWDLRNFSTRHEGKFIKKIVEQILNELKITYIQVAIYPVGIDVRMRKLSKLMGVETEKGTRMLGICGMSGIGKTTLSKALFNQYFNCFEGKSFLANVRENSRSPNGLVRLQEQLLSDILKTKKMRMSSVDAGITNIKERLCRKKVLVVLDDVDHVSQVNALARQRDWFGFGSRIIITTRDEQLLEVLQVEDVYYVEHNALDEEESLELFSWHAFQEPHPPAEFTEYSKDVASYCGRLPLALEVLGSFLGGRGVQEWEVEIEKLKKIPHSDIQKKLRLSFDGLNDDTEKDIFLDLSCFLAGMKKDLVVKILDGCGFYGDIGLGVLLSRRLVQIDFGDKLVMHDLLRDMGREIVIERSPKEPGKRSRLWLHEEVYKILKNNTGTARIEGLALELPRANKDQLNAEAFGKMQKLRLLKLNYVRLIGNFERLVSKKLRWVCWHGFPLESIPSNFYQENLVAMDMRHSSLREAWTDSKCLGNLKSLNLSHSHMLKKSPDFSKLPNLEELRLKNCTSLTELHHSIGQLGKLYFINLQDCVNLRSLPRSIYKLKSLQVLSIVGCSKIDKLHEDLGELEALTTLLADRTAIGQIPYSIVRLKNLRDLTLYGCREGSTGKSLSSYFFNWLMPERNPNNSVSFLPASLQGLSSLTTLDLGNCGLHDQAIPADLGSLSSLRELRLESNKFQFLTVKLSGLSNLTRLSVENCGRLESIQDLPPNLEHFLASNCRSLKRTPDISTFRRAPCMILTNCCKLEEVPGLEKLECSTNIRMAGCSNLSTTFRTNLIQKWSGYGMASICVPGSEVPESFHFHSAAALLSFQVPSAQDGTTLTGTTVCCVFEFYPQSDSWNTSPTVRLINTTKGRTNRYRMTALHHNSTIQGDHVWVIHLPFSYGYLLEAGDVVQLLITVSDDETRVVKRCGVRLNYYGDSAPPSGLELDEGYGNCTPRLISSDDAPDHQLQHTDPSRVWKFVAMLVLVLSVIMGYFIGIQKIVSK